MTQGSSKDADINELSGDTRLLAISGLQDRHYEILTRALTNALSSSVAQSTNGQIVDGLPFLWSHEIRIATSLCRDHPLLNQHHQLSPEVLDTVGERYSSFSPAMLCVDTSVGLFHPIALASYLIFTYV